MLHVLRSLKKIALYLSVNVFSSKVLIGDTILRLLLKTRPPVYVVIRATSAKVKPFAAVFKVVLSFLSF